MSFRMFVAWVRAGLAKRLKQIRLTAVGAK